MVQNRYPKNGRARQWLMVVIVALFSSGCAWITADASLEEPSSAHQQSASAWEEAARQHDVHYDRGRTSLYPGDRFPSLSFARSAD